MRFVDDFQRRNYIENKSKFVYRAYEPREPQSISSALERHTSVCRRRSAGGACVGEQLGVTKRCTYCTMHISDYVLLATLRRGFIAVGLASALGWLIASSEYSLGCLASRIALCHIWWRTNKLLRHIHIDILTYIRVWLYDERGS